MSKISIIIPVYNTGKYLQRCIDSIINQTYKDLDVIIVDDGSQSETSNICDSIAKSDYRIRVFHKQNEGVSVARNYGLTQAVGDYIGFVDSDDWIASDMFERLLSQMYQNTADIVYCDALTVWDNGKTESDTFTNISYSQRISHNDITPSMLFEIAGSVCRGLYRREVLESVQFPIGLKFSEDRYFNLQALSKCNSIYYLKEAFYYRYMRADSCVNSFHPDAVCVTCEGFDLMAEYAGKYWGQNYYNEYRRKHLASFTGMFYNALHSGKGFIGCYREIRNIASTPVLHELIEKYGTTDKRLLLVSNKCYFLLFILCYIHGHIKKY